jgi:hypothetical protein
MVTICTKIRNSYALVKNLKGRGNLKTLEADGKYFYLEDGGSRYIRYPRVKFDRYSLGPRLYLSDFTVSYLRRHLNIERTEIWWENADVVHLAQDPDHWCAFVNMIMNRHILRGERWAQWLLYVPLALTYQNCAFCPQSIFVCSVWFSQ